MKPEENLAHQSPPVSDGALIALINTQLESPKLSNHLERSIKNIASEPTPIPFRWITAGISIAGGIFLTVFSLLNPTQLPTQNEQMFADDLFIGMEGGWEYELFAPREFEVFAESNTVRLALPRQYAALESWTY